PGWRVYGAGCDTRSPEAIPSGCVDRNFRGRFMSQAALTVARIGNRSSEWLDRFVGFAKRHRDAWPAVVIVVATVAAYHFTLASLFDFLRLDTPLAYLPLLPLFCIGIAVITARRYEKAKRPIQDRQIDFLVGIPMVILALLLIT